MTKIYFILIFLISFVTVYAQNESDSAQVTAQTEMPQSAAVQTFPTTPSEPEKPSKDSVTPTTPTQETEKEPQATENKTEQTKNETNNPKTGDNITTSIMLFVASIATIGTLTIVKRKKARE